MSTRKSCSLFHHTVATPSDQARRSNTLSLIRDERNRLQDDLETMLGRNKSGDR